MHSVKYRAGKGENYLRIIVDRANLWVRLQKQGEKQTQELSSYSVNGGEVQVLETTDVQEGTDYLIIFEFGQTDNTY